MAEIVHITDSLSKQVFAGSSCAFGVFDGVHRGHRHILACACRRAVLAGGRSVALTFDIDPDELFAKEKLVKLMSNNERIAALVAAGVDVVAVLPFNRDFAALEPREFLDWAFADNVPDSIHVGEGFRFGRRNAGTVSDLARWGSHAHMEVYEHQLVKAGDKAISSTRIRKLLIDDNITEASVLLGQSSVSVMSPRFGEVLRVG